MALKGIYIDGVKCLFAPEDILDGGIEPYLDDVNTFVERWLEENVPTDDTVLRRDESISVRDINAAGDVNILGNISAANFDPNTFTSYQPGDNIIFTEGEGTTTISAVSPPEYIAGNNITFTEGTKQNSITIDAVDTVYGSMSEAEATAGTATVPRVITPAILRAAIKGALVVDTLSGSVKISKGASGKITIDATKSGYTLLGVVGYNCSSASTNVFTAIQSGTNIVVNVWHSGAKDDDITVNVSVRALYIKN